jgi:hypothetical protein
MLLIFEATESRFPHEDSEEDLVVQRGRIRAIDTIGRLIEDITKQGTIFKVEIPDYKGEINPKLFQYWIQ